MGCFLSPQHEQCSTYVIIMKYEDCIVQTNKDIGMSL